jgi:hypothetical protein
LVLSQRRRIASKRSHRTLGGSPSNSVLFFVTEGPWKI